MITTFGSINLDLIGTVARLPRPGETVPGGSFVTAPGGKGANQALAARRAGAAVKMFGAAGSDSFAEAALALLEADGVDLHSVRRVPGPTGIAMILVDGNGENVIAILPGANGAMAPEDADTALRGLGTGSILLLQQEIPEAATDRALELARRQGVLSILNTAPFLDGTPDLAEKASILVANETEFALLTGAGIERLDQAMSDWSRAQNQTVIVTLGPDGARAATPGGNFSVSAPTIQAVDTVGAGDTFCGYLAAGLDRGLELEAAMGRAAAAASIACLRPGAQPAIPYASELDGR